jgi:CBS domain-containing protein
VASRTAATEKARAAVRALAGSRDMNANDLMTRGPRSVRTTDRLDAAARVLWEQDCGIVPVVDAANVLVGVVTDRDLCMASYTQGRPLDEIAVVGPMARQLRTCRPDDSIATVLSAMQQAQVHRLPVVDARGVLLGIVSINDIVRVAHNRPAALDAASIVKTLALIGAPRRVVAPSPIPKESTAKDAARNVPSAAPTPLPAAKPMPAAVPGKPKGKQKGKEQQT